MPPSSRIPLTTRRLVLRRYRATDGAALHGMLSRADAVRFEPYGVIGAHRVVARCDPRNTRSWSLLDRVGLRREAHQRQAASFEDDKHGQPVWHDTFQYAVLADEWRDRTD